MGHALHRRLSDFLRKKNWLCLCMCMFPCVRNDDMMMIMMSGEEQKGKIGVRERIGKRKNKERVPFRL